MHWEFDKIYLVDMSNSQHHDLLIECEIIKDMSNTRDTDDHFELLSRPTTKTVELSSSDDQSQTPTSANGTHDQSDQIHQHNEENKLSCVNKEEISKCEMLHFEIKSRVEEINRVERNSAIDEDGDVFRTPTSLDKKIPVIPAHCPPPPKKPTSRRLLTKRKLFASLDHHRHCFRILDKDISEDLESILSPALLVDHERKIKKVE